jgi:hypothetical protein
LNYSCELVILTQSSWELLAEFEDGFAPSDGPPPFDHPGGLVGALAGVLASGALVLAVDDGQPC